MPTAHTTAAARTALDTLGALRKVTGQTKEVRALNAAIDLAIVEASKLLVLRDGDSAPIKRAIKRDD